MKDLIQGLFIGFAVLSITVLVSMCVSSIITNANENDRLVDEAYNQTRTLQDLQIKYYQRELGLEEE